MASVSLKSARLATHALNPSSSFLRFDGPASNTPDVELTFLAEIAEQLPRAVDDTDRAQGLIHRLFGECNLLRRFLAPQEWMAKIERIRSSAVLPLVHQDAFTHRAFSKPRGYAGDAVMMDLIYGQEEGWESPEMSAVGQQVFRYTTNAAASSGVRARRERIAEILDSVMHENASSDILAVASGHLREASMSSAVRRRRFDSFIALDADSKSLHEVQEAYGRYGVKAHQADIRKMLTGQLDLGPFDLIYSTGLYDYLNEKTAARLTFHLFNLLRPRGKLVIANFLPDIPDIGYMEACMDWFLIYRDRFDMVGLTKLIQQEWIEDITIRTEENQNIIFLEITRA